MPSIASQELAARLLEFGERAVAGTGIDLVDIDLRGGGKARLLRVTIDKPGGVTHTDCELVSGRLSELLDEQDTIPGEGYTLEVSSPGVERKLTKPRDFERAVGQMLRLSIRESASAAADGGATPERQSVRKLEGTLTAFANGTLTVQAASGETRDIPLAQVHKANLKFDW